MRRDQPPGHNVGEDDMEEELSTSGGEPRRGPPLALAHSHVLTSRERKGNGEITEGQRRKEDLRKDKKKEAEAEMTRLGQGRQKIEAARKPLRYTCDHRGGHPHITQMLGSTTTVTVATLYCTSTI